MSIPEGINVYIDGLRSVTAAIEVFISEALSIGVEIQEQLKKRHD
jgi:hypothetical protein